MEEERWVLRPQELYEYKNAGPQDLALDGKGNNGSSGPKNCYVYNFGGLRSWHWIDQERWVLRPQELLCIQVWGPRPWNCIERES